MKKLMLGALLSLGLASTLFAEVDLISLATNGEFNEQSQGVKVLNDEEMSQVVGGARVLSASEALYYYDVVNNSGTRVSFTAYYDFVLTTNSNYIVEEQTAYGRLNVDDGSGNYKPVVSATLNLLTNQVSVSIIGMNQYNPVYTRSADRTYADKLLQSDSRDLINTASSKIKTDARKY